MDADTKQTSASWPDVTCDKIVFVLETANRLEQELLEDWIKKNKPADSNADVVFVRIPKQGDDESR